MFRIFLVANPYYIGFLDFMLKLKYILNLNNEKIPKICNLKMSYKAAIALANNQIDHLVASNCVQ